MKDYEERRGLVINIVAIIVVFAIVVAALRSCASFLAEITKE